MRRNSGDLPPEEAQREIRQACEDEEREIENLV